jgi:hypothetical protein
MSKYFGSKSLDAEIKLDFIAQTITMDYSLNKKGSPYYSNDTVVTFSEWDLLPKITQLKYMVWTMLLYVTDPLIKVYSRLFTFSTENGLIKNKEWQYYHQNLLECYFTNTGGIIEVVHDSGLLGTTLEVPCSSNLYVKYELSGEYKENIRSVSLLRNIITYRRYGKFLEKVQRGWKVVFEFTRPPASGSCVVRYVS